MVGFISHDKNVKAAKVLLHEWADEFFLQDVCPDGNLVEGRHYNHLLVLPLSKEEALVKFGPGPFPQRDSWVLVTDNHDF